MSPLGPEEHLYCTFKGVEQSATRCTCSETALPSPGTSGTQNEFQFFCLSPPESLAALISQCTATSLDVTS